MNKFLFTKAFKQRACGITGVAAITIAVAIISTTFFSLAHATTPVQFDSWSIDNGNIDASSACSQALSCNVITSDNGFLQQIVETAEGKYIHTIVTEYNVSGLPADLGFQSETFTPFDAKARGDRKWGLDAKTVVRSATDGFVNSFTMDSDPFIDLNNNQLDIMNFQLSQTLNNAEINNHFDYTKNQVFGFPDPINNSEGYTMDIDQDVFIVAAPDTPDFIADQRFVSRKRSGWLGDVSTGELLYEPISTAGSLTLPDPFSGTSTTAWAEGETIETHWIAQTDNQGGFSSPLNYQDIKTQSGLFDDYSIQDNTKTLPIDPFDWDSTFGPAPASLQ